MKTLIKNAHVVMPDGTTQTSVLLAGNRIQSVDPPIQTTADVTIDAAGKFLLPGAIDDQVHFREPGLTHKEDLAHASRACAKGGVTSFLEMPNTVPNTISQAVLNDKLDIARGKSLVNYGFYIGATTENIEELKHVTRTPGIKIFIGSSTGDLLVDEQAALERIFAETSLPICSHCEDEATVRANKQKYADATDVAVHSRIRNHEAAMIATRRAIDLSTRHKHPFHVLHVSTAGEIPLIANAPDWVTAEVCPHHLFFNVDDYQRLGSLVKMNPSIKNREDNQQLWQALLDGTITVIATDHAPHTLEEKQQPFPACPSGLPAVENSLALLLNQVNQHKCSIEQVVKWMCSEPARIWNLQGKGRIEVGADADLVLVDMHLKQTIRNSQQQTKAKWSPWDGTELQGWPVATWVMGHQVFALRNGQCEFDDSRMGSEIQYV
jgi:dihydroorotase